MGLLARIRQLGRRSRRGSKSQSQSPLASGRWRICRFEEVEPRQLLTAAVNPVQVGAVYYEDHNQQDSTPDVIRITFEGGADGTQLTSLTIDTDKEGNGLTNGDVFFDTSSGGPGVYGYAALSIVSQNGIDSVNYTLSADGTKLTFTFTGFDAGETLEFSIDVDEMGFLGANAVAEGNEFEGSMLYASFAAPHYYAASGSDMFLDYYDEKLEKTSLDLPADDTAEWPQIYTAGAIFTLEQDPLPVSISGTVFEDIDSDNFQDTGDEGIPGVTLSLLVLEDGTYVSTGLTTTTDSQGDYSFDDLEPGTYRVVETQPSGYVSVGATAGAVDGLTRGSVESVNVITQVELEGGDDSLHNDFAEARYAKLSGYVYYDADNDGLMDAGEDGIAGVTVYLLNSAGSRTTSTVTDANGFYQFTNLKPGVWGVEEIQPEDYLDGIDSVGTAGGTLDAAGDLVRGITLVSNQSGTLYNFGEILPARICGNVAVDSDGDGLYDAGEPTLAGVTLRLLDESGNVVATTLTNADGHYCFTGLYPGVYRVEEIQPDGYFDGPDSVGSAGGTLDPTDAIDAITLTAGTHGTGYDFLEWEPVSLSGYVYVDTDNDGVFDSAEKPIAGVTLTLLDSAGKSTGVTTTTNSSGYYKFAGLAPNAVYGVAETQPAGYYDGLDTAGNLGGTATSSADTITAVSIAAGQTALEYNFGELEPASISGKVYADENQNDDYDSGETLLAGVTVYLLDSSGNRVDSTLTDANGYYEFTQLKPGVYGVEEIQPAEYFDGADQIGTAGGKHSGTDTILGAKLSSGVAATGYDFGEIAPASISGYVFQDGDTIVTYSGESVDVYSLRDGQFTSDDTPLAGVTLQLADKNGNAVLDGNGQPITTVTDAQGYYQFAGLKPGTYTVIEAQPAGYITGANTAGSNGGLPMDPVHALDATILAELAIGSDSDAILRITLRAGDAAVLNNFSEILVTEVDPPVDPPIIVPPSTPDFPDLGRPSPTVGLPDTRSAPLVYTPAATDEVQVALYGGGGIDPIAYTWHLSVIDAGLPRRDQVGPNDVAQLYSSFYFNPVSWTGADVSQSLWLLADADGNLIRQIRFGLENAFPIAGDWNGDGTIKVGVFLNGLWFLDLNGNGIWDNGDLWAQMGQIGDQPVTGDWDGDGKTDIGILGPVWAGDGRALAAEPGLPDVHNLLVGRYKNVPPDADQAPVAMRTMKRSSQGKIRADLIDHVFRFGREGDIAIAGDWNDDGISNIGLFRGGAWYLDADGNGTWSQGDVYVEDFGQLGDIPVVGDWTGDGITKIGVYRSGTFYLDANNNHALDSGDKVIHLGSAGDIPVVGDWTGDGVDKVGVYRPNAPKSEQQASNSTTDQRGTDATHNAPGVSANQTAAGGATTTAAKPSAAPVRK